MGQVSPPLVHILAIRTIARMLQPKPRSKNLKPPTVSGSALAVICLLPKEQLEIGYAPFLRAVVTECGQTRFREVVTPETAVQVARELPEPGAPIASITPTMTRLLRELSQRRATKTVPKAQLSLL